MTELLVIANEKQKRRHTHWQHETVPLIDVIIDLVIFFKSLVTDGSK